MNNMNNCIYLFLLLLCFTSCSEDTNIINEDKITDKETIEESVNTKSNLELSDSTLIMSYQADTAIIKINGTGWWIEEIITEEETLKPTAEEKQLMAKGGAYEAKCQWVNVKRNGSSIEVAVDENVYAERTFKIVLATADSTATITGVQEEMITGWWDDIIGLSTKTVTLNGAGDPATVTTEGKHWWITSIEVDGETLYNSYYDNTENRNMYQTGKFNKKCDWLNVSVDDWTLNISADMNYGAGRTFKIYLQAGDYHDCIDGTQEELMTGGGTPINLKPKQVTIPAEGGTQTCTTDKDIAWIIHCTYINDNIYYATLDEKENCADTGKFEKTYEWLTVKRDGENLYVTAQPNNTGKERTFKVVITAGDAGDTLYGTQPAQ